MTTRRVLLVVALCAVVTYALALGGGFTGDDGHIIAGNALVHGWGGVVGAFGSPYWPPAFGGALYRPLVVATYAIDWMLSGGSAVWFHAVNALWHAGASVLVGYVAAQLVEGREWGALKYEIGSRAALGAGLIFAVHPVHVEAVANVVGRAELMAAVFTLLAVHGALRGRLVWSVAAWAAGLLSKENAVVAPALIAVAWGMGLGVRPDRKRLVGIVAGWVLVGAGYAALRSAVLGAYASLWTPAPVFVGQSAVTVRLTAISEFTDVARLLIVPVNLRVDYSPLERTAVTTLTDSRFVLGALIAVAFGAALAGLWRRGRRAEAFGVTWIAVAFLPVANVFFPIGVLMAERTLYLPSVGLALAAGALAARMPARIEYGLAFAAVVAAGAVRSVYRIPVWHDNLAFAQSIRRDSPLSYQGEMAAAGILLERGRPDLSLTAARRAIDLFPLDPRPYLIGAHSAMKLGRWPLADSLMSQAGRHCRPCEGVFAAQEAEARALGDSGIADSLRRYRP